MQDSFKVTIDGKQDTLTKVYVSGAGIQYNTQGNKSAYTFNSRLNNFPKNKEIRTNGITLVILS